MTKTASMTDCRSQNSKNATKISEVVYRGPSGTKTKTMKNSGQKLNWRRNMSPQIGGSSG